MSSLQSDPVELEEIKVKIIGSCTKSSTKNSSSEVTYRGESSSYPMMINSFSSIWSMDLGETITVPV